MKAMRVLMFGWEFPPHNSGGLGVACLGISKGLSALGAEVVFVLPKKVPLSSPFAKIIFADIDTPPSHTRRRISGYITPDGYRRLRAFDDSFYGGSLFEEVRRYAEVAGRIASIEAHDVIHAHDWLSFPAGIEARRISGKPLIVHVHATEFDRTGGRSINQDVYDIEREGMHAADGVIAVSGYTKNILVERYGVPADKIEVVHNAVDIEETSPYGSSESPLTVLKRSGKKIVLFVGRITIQKGPDYFVAAAKKVLEHNPNVVFVVSGSGDMEGQIMNQAAFLGIGDKVIFTGFLRGKELDDIYRIADLFVMPSISEPFGITPLEAIAHGTPVIVSKQSGVSEVLRHALKVDFWDVDEMANKILCVLRYPSLQECLKENSIFEVMKYTWKKAAEKCMMVYKKVFRNA